MLNDKWINSTQFRIYHLKFIISKKRTGCNSLKKTGPYLKSLMSKKKIKNNKMAQINILIAVDAPTLAQQIQDGSLPSGAVNAPHNLGSYTSSNVYISMVTQNNNVDNNTQGLSELTIRCDSGDELQWSMVSFDMNTGYTPYLYNGTFVSVVSLEKPTPTNTPPGIAPLTYVTAEVVNYFPLTAEPTDAPVEATNTIARAVSFVTEPGQTIQYTLSFALVDNANGEIIGYFSWDPFIATNSA